MNFLKCNEYKYEENCPVMWSYCNAACITMQKKKENIMDNSIYEVEREDYKAFLGQLNFSMMDHEEYSLEDCEFVKIISKKTGKHLCTRIADNKEQKEHYFIFEYPDSDERVEPKPVWKINLNTKEEVQGFFNALSQLQKEEKND